MKTRTETERSMHSVIEVFNLEGSKIVKLKVNNFDVETLRREVSASGTYFYLVHKEEKVVEVGSFEK
jgi:hypothetical protein